MESEILQSIVEMTRQHDLDSLEYSLVATLAELVPAHRISIYKPVNDDNHNQLEEVVRLFVDMDTKKDSHYEWKYNSKLITADDHMKQCLQENTPVKFKDHGYVQLLMPVISRNKRVGILAIESKNDLSDFELLIDGFTKIYTNYLFILNESERDKLTGLFNRRTFDLKLKKLLKMQHEKREEYAASNNDEEKRNPDKTSRAWLVIMDIDHFKKVNDSFGHLYGDEVILLISQKMKQCFRNTDLLFRFGGEEFVIILEPLPDTKAHKILESFRQTIAAHNFPQIGQVTISIGYAMIRESDYPPAILNLADKALYYAKEHGRNCTYNYEQLVAEGEIKDQKKSGTVDLF